MPDSVYIVQRLEDCDMDGGKFVFDGVHATLESARRGVEFAWPMQRIEFGDHQYYAGDLQWKVDGQDLEGFVDARFPGDHGRVRQETLYKITRYPVPGLSNGSIGDSPLLERLAPLIAKAEAGDWSAVGELIDELRPMDYRVRFEHRAVFRDFQATVFTPLKGPPHWMAWYGYALLGPQAAARAVVNALKNVESADA